MSYRNLLFVIISAFVLGFGVGAATGDPNVLAAVLVLAAGSSLTIFGLFPFLADDNPQLRRERDRWKKLYKTEQIVHKNTQRRLAELRELVGYRG